MNSTLNAMDEKNETLQEQVAELSKKMSLVVQCLDKQTDSIIRHSHSGLNRAEKWIFWFALIFMMSNLITSVSGFIKCRKVDEPIRKIQQSLESLQENERFHIQWQQHRPYNQRACQ